MWEHRPPRPPEGLTDAPALDRQTHSTIREGAAVHASSDSCVPLPCIVETPWIVGTVPNVQKSRFPLILCLLPWLQKGFAPASLVGHLAVCWPPCDVLGRQSVYRQDAAASVWPPHDSVSQDRAAWPPPPAVSDPRPLSPAVGRLAGAHTSACPHTSGLWRTGTHRDSPGPPGVPLPRGRAQPQRRCFSFSSPEIWGIS